MRSNRQIWYILVPLLWVACDMPSKPGVTEPGYRNASVNHEKFSAECAECHEDMRPPPVLDVVHGLGKDCHECHEYKEDQIIWVPKPYSHDPAPTECQSCHAADRNSASTHPKTGDCADCHKYPDWLP
jgi:hypothetical protein